MDAAYLQKVIKGPPDTVEVRVKPKEGVSEVAKQVVTVDEGTGSCKHCGERVEPNTALPCGGDCNGS